MENKTELFRVKNRTWRGGEKNNITENKTELFRTKDESWKELKYGK